MSSVKQCDDSSEWEGAPATKRRRASQESEQVELQDDQDNYGTLSSERPKRDRKRPERYSDLSSQSARKKVKALPKKGATKPKLTPSPRKPTATPKHQRQQVATAELQGPVNSPTNHTPPVSGKKSVIVRLKVTLGGTVPTTPPPRSFLNGQGSGLDSVLSSPPDALPTHSLVSSVHAFLLKIGSNFNISALSSLRLKHLFHGTDRANVLRMCQHLCRLRVKPS
jgi:hypothetical protein